MKYRSITGNALPQGRLGEVESLSVRLARLPSGPSISANGVKEERFLYEQVQPTRIVVFGCRKILGRS